MSLLVDSNMTKDWYVKEHEYNYRHNWTTRSSIINILIITITKFEKSLYHPTLLSCSSGFLRALQQN